MLDLGCSRSGERHDGAGSDLHHHRAYAPIFGTEVVPPFGDTVRLVHSVEGDRHFAQQLDILLLVERLRCYVEELRPALSDILLDLLELSP